MPSLEAGSHLEQLLYTQHADLRFNFNFNLILHSRRVVGSSLYKIRQAVLQRLKGNNTLKRTCNSIKNLCFPLGILPNTLTSCSHLPQTKHSAPFKWWHFLCSHIHCINSAQRWGSPNKCTAVTVNAVLLCAVSSAFLFVRRHESKAASTHTAWAQPLQLSPPSREHNTPITRARHCHILLFRDTGQSCPLILLCSSTCVGSCYSDR